MMMMRFGFRYVIRKSCFYAHVLINNNHNHLTNFNFVSKYLIHSLPNSCTNSSITILSGLKLVTYPIIDDRSVVDIDIPCLKPHYLKIRGHSHGIVCLSDSYGDIFFCNPITKEVHQLPPSILLTPTYRRYLYDIDLDTWINHVGFGYNPKSKDFKVFRIVDYEFEGIIYPCRIEIYDLSKDRWREIETTMYGYIDSSSFVMDHQSGFYYCTARHYCPIFKDDINCVLSFDMNKEIFRRITVPESHNSRLIKRIGVWNGSIVLFLYPFKDEFGNKTFKIWKMENGESWSELFTIGPNFLGIRHPLLFVNSDELLMETEDGEVISYHIDTKEREKLPLKSRDGVFIFTKTLLSLKGGIGT